MITTIYPNKYLASNNDIKINIQSDENKTDHKVIMNLLDNDTIPFVSSNVILSYVTLDGILRTKFTLHTSQQGKFKLDDIIYLYGKIYNIIEATDAYFIIDDLLYLTVPVTGSDVISRSLRQFKAPFVNGNITFNLREYTSSLVKSNFKVTNLPYPGVINNRALKLVFQESYKIEWQFTDNQFVNGSLGFISNTTPPFNIGDKIIVEQDFQEWSFNNIDNLGGNVRLFGAQTVEYIEGENVIITQSVESPLNGTWNILQTGSNYIIIDCPYINPPTTTGKAYSHARPSYNGVANITNITGNLITTDKPFVLTTRAIGGKISLFNKNVLIGSTIQSYQFHLYQAQRSLDNQLADQNNNLIDYITFDGTMPKREIKWSTVMLQGRYEDTTNLNYGTYNKGNKQYKSEYVYPINVNAISSINVLENTNAAVYVELYDKNKQWLNEFEFPLNNSNSTLVPISLASLKANTSIQFDIEDVKFYNVFIIDKTVDRRLTRSLSFEIVDECKFDTIDLLYRDSMGSLVPIPFYKLSREFVESDKKYFNTDKVEGMISKGDIVYNSRSKVKYILNTDWVQEHSSKLITDLIKSSEIYLHNHKSEELFRVNVTSTQVEEKKMINDKLIQFTIEVESSNTNKHK